MQRIPYSEIVFHPLSFVDPSGRLFWWKGQLYRAISAERAPLYRRLFDEGIVQRLVNKGLLIETEITSLQIDGYEMVLRHRELPFVSYPYEWCAAMLKDAAITIIDIEIELAQHGLTLQDAHPWNVLFDGPKPIYVDFGSIVPAQASTLWPAYDEFCRFFVYPLYLMSQGYGRIARWLLHDYDQGVLKSDLVALTRKSSLGLRAKDVAMQLLSMAKQRVPRRFRPGLKKGLALVNSKLLRLPAVTQFRLGFLQQVRREVEGISVPSLRTEWSEYYDGSFPSFSPSDDWTVKHVSVHQVLSDLRPDSVLDIGSNRGWYSQLAALLGSRVVAFDADESCITQLYYDSKEKNLPILSLIMDFRNPSPGYGLCNQWLAPAIERLKCDMVLALALVHHLVFKQRLNFDQIVNGLSVFSKRWLLVEFIPSDDRYVREWWSEKFSWYTLDNFIGALKKRFHIMRILPSYPEPRVLLLCEK
jgi:SAM-dependent methyltransferase